MTTPPHGILLTVPTTPTTPGAPTGVTYSAIVNGTVAVGWTPPTLKGKSLPWKWSLSFVPSSGTTVTATGDDGAANPSVTVSGLDATKTYTASLTLTNLAGLTSAASVTTGVSAAGSGWQVNPNLIVPSSFPVPSNVGMENRPSGLGGPVTRAALTSSFGSATKGVVSGVGAVLDQNAQWLSNFTVSVTTASRPPVISGCLIDNNGTAPTPYGSVAAVPAIGATVTQTVGGATLSGGSIRVAPIPGTTGAPIAVPLLAGSFSTPAGTLTPLNVLVGGANSNDVELMYFGYLQNADGTVNTANTFAPTSNSDGTWTYYVANAAGQGGKNNPGTYFGFRNADHGIGQPIQAVGNVGSSVSWTKPYTTTARVQSAIAAYFQWCTVGTQSNPAGGGTTATDPTWGARWLSCYIGWGGDIMKIIGNEWFTRCIFGPNLAPANAPAYHSDGWQNGSATNNVTTGTCWVDLDNQQYRVDWAASTTYPAGSYVVATPSGGVPGVYTNAATLTSGSTFTTTGWTLVTTRVLHLPGQTWLISDGCTHVAVEYQPGGSFSHYQHSVMFLPSGTQKSGVVEQILVNKSFLAGAVNMILDNTSVNSDASQTPDGLRPGVRRMIVRGCTFGFVASAGPSTATTLAQNAAADPGASTLAIVTNDFLSGGSQYTLNPGGANAETIYITNDATPIAGTTTYLVPISTSPQAAAGLVNSHLATEPVGSSGNGITAGSFVPNVSKAVNSGAGSAGSIITPNTFNYSAAASAAAGATSIQITVPNSKAALGPIPPLVNPACYPAQGQVSILTWGVNSVTVTGTGTQSGNVITLPVSALPAALPSGTVLQSNVTAWVEIADGDFSSVPLTTNVWVLNTNKDSNGGVVTLAEALLSCTDPHWTTRVAPAATAVN